MIPVYICDDEQTISECLKKIISDQIMILDGDMGPVRVADAPAKLLELQRQDTVLVKASHGMQFEKVVEMIAKTPSVFYTDKC